MAIVCEDSVTRINPQTGLIKRGFVMDNNLKDNLDNWLIPAVHAKWDGVCLMTGIEGSGKSTLTSQICKYVSTQVGRPFCDKGIPNEIVFTQDQLMHLIDTCPPESIIMFDEAAMAAMAQDAASAMQIALIKKFVTIRKKRLFIFLVIPSIFMLRRYFAIFRTRVLIHTSTPDGVSRGWFKFYSYDTKRLLYIRGSKEFDQGACRPDFEGSFVDTDGLIYDSKLYDDKKEDAIRSINQSKLDEKERPTKTLEKALSHKGILALASWKLYTKFIKDKHAREPKLKEFKAFLAKHFSAEISEADLKKCMNDALIAIAAKREEAEKLEKGKEIAKV